MIMHSNPVQANPCPWPDGHMSHQTPLTSRTRDRHSAGLNLESQVAIPTGCLWTFANAWRIRRAALANPRMSGSPFTLDSGSLIATGAPASPARDPVNTG
jgi:hypothetical protein